MHPPLPRRLSGALLAAAGCCLLVLPTASAQQSPPPARPANTTCVSGVHMIVARASEEPPGPGFLGKLANDLVSKIPGSDFVAVDYPAKLSDYKASQKAGLVAMTNLINDYTAACPNSKIVLMGYSQGAHISADVVCGASETTFDNTSALPEDKASKIAAVVMMGDPSRNASAPFNKGNATKDGVFPRANLAGCGALTSRMVSFCSAGDMFCDNGPDLEVHLTYVDTQGQAAAQFVLDQVKKTQSAPRPRALILIQLLDRRHPQCLLPAQRRLTRQPLLHQLRLQVHPGQRSNGYTSPHESPLDNAGIALRG
ncbi:hypothetical protein MAPG_01224 [Magnaporthiopsis poae ATCC 64411]|uniref:Acetylxylan esterase n=1 Tax=Magnaporthiopsis poae (strain ATCC 64411 / 73-15) TaxID=644358 RepID=A0A0C4DN50_MAGP6|nr:hypothetical protein MAPG_01224 [Magnaporthiopsis poae ATCC 64411]